MHHDNDRVVHRPFSVRSTQSFLAASFIKGRMDKYTSTRAGIADAGLGTGSACTSNAAR